jgi:hypothetical protein
MGIKNTRGKLVCDSEVSEGGEGNGWSTGQPGPPVDNPLAGLSGSIVQLILILTKKSVAYISHASA